MLALDAGYYDQAHLVDEFRELTGLTPAAWWKTQRPG
jgi:AraC-like DNA-binding protein